MGRGRDRVRRHAGRADHAPRGRSQGASTKRTTTTDSNGHRKMESRLMPHLLLSAPLGGRDHRSPSLLRSVY